MGANDDGSIDAHLQNAIEYILNPEKLGEANLVGGINCLPGTAYEQMKSTKEFFGKTGGRQGYHMILALPPGEGTPENMYNIACEFAEKAFHGEYETLIAVHTNKEHLHAHIIINSVNLVTGLKFQYHKGDWKHYYQPITNEICAKYGYEVMPAEYSKDPKNVPRPVWEREQSFKDLIKNDVYFCAYQAEDERHFCYLLSSLGYEVKQGKHIAVKAKDMKRFRRLDTITEDFSRESLSEMIRYGDSSMASTRNYSLNPIYVKRAKLTPYQKKYYAKLYRLRLIEKKRFTYRSADFYTQIKLMHQLQEEYLFLCKHDIKSFEDLIQYSQKLTSKQDELSEVQKSMYDEKSAYKKNPKRDVNIIISDDKRYHDRLERIKNEKKEIRKEQKIIYRCVKREHSEIEKMLEDMIPLDDRSMQDADIDVMAMRDIEVPENPYKATEISEASVEEDVVIDVPRENAGKRDAISDSYEYEPVFKDEIDEYIERICAEPRYRVTESESQEKANMPDTTLMEVADVNESAAASTGTEKPVEDITENGVKEPQNLTEYRLLSLDEKVELFHIAETNMDELPNKIMNYLSRMGADFDTAFTEYNKVVKHYADHEKQLFIEKEVKQQLSMFRLLEMTKKQILRSTPEMLARVFNFEDVDYSVGIMIYRKVLEGMGIHKGFDELYDEYDRIYAASQKEKKRDVRDEKRR